MRMTAPLWIAFRFCIFDLEPQPSPPIMTSTRRCELLSDFVSLTLSHNYRYFRYHRETVVNCFQILYLWPWATTEVQSCSSGSLLWIAFRFCIFDLEPQPLLACRIVRGGCELLSDFVSLTLSHNIELAGMLCSSVVNCFQILYLWPWATTSALTPGWCACCELLSDFVSLTLSHNSSTLVPGGGRLWIAFRFCIFDLEPQPPSNFSMEGSVVNCFQILYLWPWATTCLL